MEWMPLLSVHMGTGVRRMLSLAGAGGQDGRHKRVRCAARSGCGVDLAKRTFAVHGVNLCYALCVHWPTPVRVARRLCSDWRGDPLNFRPAFQGSCSTVSMPDRNSEVGGLYSRCLRIPAARRRPARHPGQRMDLMRRPDRRAQRRTTAMSGTAKLARGIGSVVGAP